MNTVNRFFSAERMYSTAPDCDVEAKEKAKQDWLSTLHPEDFTLDQSPDLPWGGNYKGREGFLTWVEKISRYISKIDVETIDVLENKTGTCVTVWATCHWTIRASGEDISYPFAQVWQIDPKSDTILSCRPFYWDVRGFKERIGAA